MNLLLVLEDAVEVLQRISGGNGGGPSILRLDDVMQVRAPAEEFGLAESEVYEGGRILSPRSPVPPRIRGDGLRFLGVDSSSREINAPPASVVVAAVSVSGGTVEIHDWPPVYGGYPYRGSGPPFARILPNTDPPPKLSLPEWFTSLNPAGAPYSRDYSLAQAMDEARVDLENWALVNPVYEVASYYLEQGYRPVVLVDGPIFLVPGVLAGGGEYREEYASAWRILLEARIRAIEYLESAGVPVLGVVKRLQKSRILARTPGVSDDIERCLGDSSYSDEHALHAIYRSGCIERRPGFIHKTPKIKLRIRGYVEAEKIAEYLLVPPGRYQDSPGLVRALRVEYTERSLEIMKSWGLEPYQVYSLASLAGDSLLPVPLQASDRRAKMITRALKETLARMLVARGMPLDYEELGRVEVGWPGMRS